ncbi:MAG: glycoside hydrolase N-terminal domain-containing protein [Verrucomicrobiota bacterium]
MKNLLTHAALAAILVPLCPVMAGETLSAVSDPAALMPRHGTVSSAPATKWEDGLAAGNGTMGALLYGDARHDTLLVDHCKLWLPAGSREVLPNGSEFLPEMRRIIGENGYDTGQKYFLKKAEESGWSGKLVWTDAFHPGFFLNIDQPQDAAITDFARIEDFSTGEVWSQWRSAQGEFSRRMFVSKTDNTIVSVTTGPRGKVALKLTMQKVASPLIDSTVTHADGWITCHNTYVKGKGGYDGAVRVITGGGTQTSDGSSITVAGADSVTLMLRILPWRTPLPESQAWPNDPANPEFEGASAQAKRATVQLAAKAYDPQWMDQLKSDLQSLSTDYARLLQPHSAAWSGLFDRVSIDLGGAPAERAMSSEALLDKAQKDQRLSAALLERMYDAGRYVFMCSAGPETPPNLFGIWTGTWSPQWSGDYTTDTNLQLDTELAYSANLAECMSGYFHLWDSYLPDFRRNAKALYGCRGILTGSRASNNGLALHWDGGWPGNLWTPGASWIAHWYYDYYQYTGDKAFLRNSAIPFMKECALFWEDFLMGSEDAAGHYLFRPSYSAENGWGDNSSQDIEIVTELLSNLIAGCETAGVDKEGVVKWKAMLAKLPPLLINQEGQLKEWSNPTQGEHNDHRHLMHLYGAFESERFSEEADPKLFEAAKVALQNRVSASREDATHGFMHTGLAAAGLGMGDMAFARIEELAKHRSIYPSMVDGHFGGPNVLCDDGNGATPEIVDRMLIQSKVGRLALLPAVPKALPKGSITGTRARGGITINKLSWDLNAGTCEAFITSDSAQTITLVMARDMEVKTLTLDGKSLAVTNKGVRKPGADLQLPPGKGVAIAVKFTPKP